MGVGSVTGRREIREAAGMTQLKVAMATGKSISRIVSYEAGGNVSALTRAALEPFYKQLAEKVGKQMGSE